MRSMSLRVWLALGAALLGTVLSAKAGQEIVPSAWADRPVAIDGSKAEWQGVPLTEWKKGAVACAFRNDGETLFVLFVIQDPKFRSSIETSGITLHFGAGAANAKDYGIRFKKMSVTPDEYIAVLERQGPVPEEQKAGLRSKAGFLLYHHQVLDRKGRPVEPAREPTVRPAVFKYAPETGGAVVYEFAIPLVRESGAAAGVGAGPGQTVAIGFVWGGETEAMRKAAAKRLREQANFANEELEGGEKPIIGSVGSGPAPKKYDFWTVVKLAAKSEIEKKARPPFREAGPFVSLTARTAQRGIRSRQVRSLGLL